MIGNEEDFTACLGLEVEGIDDNLTELDAANFRAMIERAVAEFPNFTRRRDDAARRAQRDRQRLVGDRVVARSRASSRRRQRPGLEILDRVGGGDSFASGLIYGLLEHGDLAHRRRVRRGPRRAGDDHPRRHLDGDARRGRGARRRDQRSYQPLTRKSRAADPPLFPGLYSPRTHHATRLIRAERPTMWEASTQQTSPPVSLRHASRVRPPSWKAGRGRDPRPLQERREHPSPVAAPLSPRTGDSPVDIVTQNRAGLRQVELVTLDLRRVLPVASPL